MKSLWVRIGVGAAVVFAAGMFVITLGRQVRNAAADAIRDGGRFRVPLAILPFEVQGSRMGSVREIQVDRSAPGAVKRIRVTVALDEGDASALSDCVVTLGGPGRHSLFDCATLSEAEADGLVKVGEVRFEPSGLVRPIMLDARHLGDWFDAAEAGELSLRADGEGVNLLATDGDGAAVVRLQADSHGANLMVRDEQGREVVRLQAGAEGVQIRVKSETKPPE